MNWLERTAGSDFPRTSLVASAGVPALGVLPSRNSGASGSRDRVQHQDAHGARRCASAFPCQPSRRIAWPAPRPLQAVLAAEEHLVDHAQAPEPLRPPARQRDCGQRCRVAHNPAPQTTTEAVDLGATKTCRLDRLATQPVSSTSYLFNSRRRLQPPRDGVPPAGVDRDRSGPGRHADSRGGCRGSGDLVFLPPLFPERLDGQLEARAQRQLRHRGAAYRAEDLDDRDGIALAGEPEVAELGRKRISVEAAMTSSVASRRVPSCLLSCSTRTAVLAMSPTMPKMNWPPPPAFPTNTRRGRSPNRTPR